MAVDKELKDRLDAIINGLNSLTGKKKGMSSQQDDATNTSSVKNSFNSAYNFDRETEYKQALREIERETAEIKDNIFGYETVYKRINRLETERKKLLNDLLELQKKGESTALKEYQIARNLNELEKEKARLQIDGYTKLDEANGK